MLPFVGELPERVRLHIAAEIVKGQSELLRGLDDEIISRCRRRDRRIASAAHSCGVPYEKLKNWLDRSRDRSGRR